MCAAENLFMVFASVCKLPMAVKCWPAAGQKAVINLLFLTNALERNKKPSVLTIFESRDLGPAFFGFVNLSLLSL
jgi:hypothetical protein